MTIRTTRTDRLWFDWDHVPQAEDMIGATIHALAADIEAAEPGTTPAQIAAALRAAAPGRPPVPGSAIEREAVARRLYGAPWPAPPEATSARPAVEPRVAIRVVLPPDEDEP